MTNKFPTYDQEEVIDRLINENRQYLNFLNEIKLILSNQSDFDGTSHVGGVKLLMTKYLELRNKIYLLEEKIKKLEK